MEFASANFIEAMLEILTDLFDVEFVEGIRCLNTRIFTMRVKPAEILAIFSEIWLNGKYSKI